MRSLTLLLATQLGLAAACSGSIGTGGNGSDGGPSDGGGDSAAGDANGADARSGDAIGGDGGGTSCVPSLPTFADNKSPTATIHVQAGAAAGGNGSIGAPFATLSAGLAAAQPGSEVRVSGNHTDSTYRTGLHGNPAEPIWVRGQAGASIGPLTLESVSYVIVEDLEIAGNGSGHVLHFFFSDHLMMRRLRIHDAGLGCIKGSQTTFAYVEDSELWNAGQQSSHPILDFVGVNTGHIIDSEFHDGTGVMIMLKGGTSDLLFAWNEVYGQAAAGNVLALGQSTGPQFFQPLDSAFEGLRIVAFGNLLHDLTGAPVAFEGCKDCAALHNTAWNTTGAQLVRFLPGAAGQTSGATVSLSEGCRFAGNIIVGGQAGGATLNADAPNVGPGNVIDYNVFLKPGALNWWGVIAQDTVHSTYTDDPQLSSTGVPANTLLVDGLGPPDIGTLPLSSAFGRDALGQCFTVPGDIGAVQVP